MISFLRALLVILALALTHAFGETLEQFLLQVIRIFIAVEPSNAVRFNLVHILILLSPLVLLGILVSIATVDDPALRKRAQKIVLGMLLGLLAYRIFQIWWIVKLGAMGEFDTSRTESFSAGQILFLERIAPWLILGSASALVPAVTEPESDSNFYAALASLCLFVWLVISNKLPPGQGFGESVTSLGITVAAGFLLGRAVLKIKAS